MIIAHKIIIYLVLASCITHGFLHAMVSLKEAKKQYAPASANLQETIKALRNYYEAPMDGQESAYERELRAICQKALDEHFKEKKVTPKSAIVFDIDETLLTDYKFFKECNFEWTIEDAYQYRFKKECSAIRPMQNFYNQLKALGYTLILLTSRREALYQVTQENLTKEGYVFDTLILLPMDLFNQHVSHGAWKASMRKTLSQHYDIVGCVGDSPSDFEGDCCGVQVRLPNYLY